MNDHANVVVVGGGVMGLATALHLRDAGVEHVRVVERDTTFQGTSAAGAGFIAYWAMAYPTHGAEEVAVERYGLSYYRNLHETGRDIDYYQNGLLAVAPDERSWREIEPFTHVNLDIRNQVVDADRIEELTSGVIRASGVFRGVFQPAAAQIFAPKLGKALTDLFLEQGGLINERRPVTALIVRGGRVVGVTTPTGTIEADNVILAAGAWTNELLRPLGLYLPMIPQVTSRIITDPLSIPSSLPLLFLMGARLEPGGPFLWVRAQDGRLLFGGTYKTSPRNAFVGTAVSPRFDEVSTGGVLECQRLATQASRYMPVFNRYDSFSLKHGAPCYTPDHRALVGPVPGIEGLYAMTGDCEAGITHGPGFGKALADQIVHGSSDLTSIHAWRIDRFNGQYCDDKEILEAIVEADRERALSITQRS